MKNKMKEIRPNLQRSIMRNNDPSRANKTKNSKRIMRNESDVAKLRSLLLLLSTLIATAGSACTLNFSLSDHGPSASSGDRDQTLVVETDKLVKEGKLAEAKQLLEQEEDQRGLTPEISDKLDTVYIEMAKKAIANGKRSEAADLLKLIPADAAKYQIAQALLKKLH